MNTPTDHETVALDDGAELVLRPLVRADRELLVTMLGAMSAASRHYRFGTAAMPQDDDVDALLDVDGTDQVAIAAVAAATDDDPEGVGVARFLVDDGDRTMAEATVAVVDHWQGRGAGTRLLARLVREARQRGVVTFRNYVLADNRRALRLLDALGADEPVRRGDVVVVDLPVPRAGQRLRESLTGRALVAAAVEDLRFAFHHPLLAARQLEQASRLGKGEPDADDEPPHVPEDLSNPDLDDWLASTENGDDADAD